MQRLVFLLTILFAMRCNYKQNANDKATAITSETGHQKHRENFIREKIIGVWTDDSAENASFEITTDSIYYVDELASFKYEINQDTIKINYLDWTFVGRIEFIGDTLMLISEDTSKFWKFKN